MQSSATDDLDAEHTGTEGGAAAEGGGVVADEGGGDGSLLLYTRLYFVEFLLAPDSCLLLSSVRSVFSTGLKGK